MKTTVINGIDLSKHLGLLGMAVRGYPGGAGNAVDREDLFNAGFFGLRRAAERFDPSLGYRFSTYATYWIRHAVQRAIANQDRTIRVPVWLRERTHRERGTLPPDTLSLDALVRADEGGKARWLDTLAGDDDPTENASATERRAAIEEAVAQLPERLRHVIRARFWDNETLAQIGERMNLTRERVRQLEGEALRLLEQHLENDLEDES